LERFGRSRLAAVLLVLVVLAAVSAVSALATGEAELVPQYGGEPPAGFEPGEAPAASPAGIASLTQVGEEAVEAREDREEELASPALEAEREASRTEFTDATQSEAADLFVDEFGVLLEAATIDSAALSEGGQVAVFLDDFTMRVDRPGAANDALVESPLPLRVENEQGVEAPVDLSLESAAEEFAPSNPVVDVSLPETLEDGAEVGGVSVFPSAGAAGGSEAQLLDGGKATLYHEAVTDTDVVLAPVATGLEASWLVRSPQAPAQQRLRFALPTGGEIVLAPDGGADLVDGDTRLGRVLPAMAIDAQGEPVDVSYEVDGDELVVDVDHQNGDVAYPVWVDPVVEDWLGASNTQSWYHGYNSDGQSQWFWTSNQPATNSPFAPRVNCYTPVSCYKPAGMPVPPYGRGLYAYVFPGAPYQIPGGTFAEWVYDPPGATTQVTQAVLGPNFLQRRSSGQNPYFFLGIWAGGLSDWTAITSYPTIDLSGNYTTLNAGSHRPNSGANNVAIGYFSPSTVTLPAWRDFAVGGARITLTDPENPTITDSGLPETSEWTNDATYTVEPTATDPGLGIKSLTLKVPKQGGGYAIQTRTHSCTGRRANPCPATWALLNGTANSFTFSTNDADPTTTGNQPMAEGTSMVEVIAQDALGKTTTVRTTSSIDTEPPNVDLSGSFINAATATQSYEDGTVVVDGDTRTLKNNSYGVVVSASDRQTDPETGDPTGPEASGIKSIEFKVDGDRKDYTEQPCSVGSCTMEFDWIFDNTAYGAGPHTVEVLVTDQVGHVTIRSFTVNTVNEIGECPSEVGYDVYWLGEEFNGAPLTSQTRMCSAADAVNPAFRAVVTTYGDCDTLTVDGTEPLPEAQGCAYPLTIVSSPHCDANPSQYEIPAMDDAGELEEPVERFDYDVISLRGVPAADYEAATTNPEEEDAVDTEETIEIYSANSTIKITGDDEEDVLEAADELRGLAVYDTYTSSSDPLPSPTHLNVDDPEDC
jgi:hypothetical protein